MIIVTFCNIIITNLNDVFSVQGKFFFVTFLLLKKKWTETEQEKDFEQVGTLLMLYTRTS